MSHHLTTRRCRLHPVEEGEWGKSHQGRWSRLPPPPWCVDTTEAMRLKDAARLIPRRCTWEFSPQKTELRDWKTIAHPVYTCAHEPRVGNSLRRNMRRSCCSRSLVESYAGKRARCSYRELICPTCVRSVVLLFAEEKANPHLHPASSLRHVVSHLYLQREDLRQTSAVRPSLHPL